MTKQTLAMPATVLAFLFAASWRPAHCVLNGVFSPKKDYFVLLTRTASNTVHCGGTLIAPDMVLTAAHCFDGVIDPGSMKPEADTAWVGRQADQGWEEIGKAFNLGTVWIPQSYDSGDTTNKGDYAIIQLVEQGDACPSAGKFDDNTVWANYRNVIGIGFSASLYLFGFGRTTSAECVSRALRWAEAQYELNGDCEGRSEGYDAAVHLCTETAISCQGDSGGPLIFPDAGSGQDSIFGIASFLNEEVEDYCGNGAVDVYTRVSSFAENITSVVCQYSQRRPDFCNTAAWHADKTMIRVDLPTPSTFQRRAWSVVQMATRAGNYMLDSWFN